MILIDMLVRVAVMVAMLMMISDGAIAAGAGASAAVGSGHFDIAENRQRCFRGWWVLIVQGNVVIVTLCTTEASEASMCRCSWPFQTSSAALVQG